MHATPLPFGFARSQFLLDPSWTFLNHGSFGAVPAAVRMEQERWRQEVEAQPVHFLARRWWPLVQAAREPVAELVGARPRDIAFVQNATAGVQAVVRSLRLAPGERIVTTSHRYDAVHRILKHACDRSGTALVEADFPRQPSPDAVLESVLSQCVRGTKLVVVDAVTSPTAEVLPLATLIPALRDRGVRVLVDGAHAPGLIDVDLQTLQPDYWVGNLHKWICAPRGTAVLFVDPALQAETHAPVTSHGHELGFHAEFDWTGTFDPTGWLSAPAAVAQHRAWGGSLLRSAHRRLATHYRQQLYDALQLGPPPAGEAECAMVTVPLGVPDTHWRTGQMWLAEQRVEAPLIPWNGETLLRISAFAAYNTETDIQPLVDLLPALQQVLRSGTAP